jgi:outer membrane protein W
MKTTLVLIIFLILTLSASAQFNRTFGVSLNAVYNTSASIYLSPNSSDVVLRNNSFIIEDIFNPAIDFRYRLTESIFMGFNTEYMTSTAVGPNLTVFLGNSTVTINVEDGFKLIPLELSAYYLLPFSTERFKFLMGGGLGYYIGSHVRKFGDVEVSNVERKAAYGIHVSISMDYLVRDFISVRSEMKFRDPQFTVKNKYSSKVVNYNGSIINLAQDSFDSKINVDGVTFIFGLAFHF